MKARWALLWIVAALGCEAPADPARAPLEAAPRLVALGPASADLGPDEVPRVRVAFAMPDGTTRPVDREAIAHVPRFGDGAALVDPERRLYEVSPDGMRRMLAAGATGSLAVSEDGARLAYVVARDVLGELRVHDGRDERTLAEGLASIGVLRVLDERVLFVGGRPGGIAGVWTAALDGGARCLTNCALRTGTDWRPDHVPPPSDPATFALVDGAVTWTDPSGEAHAVALEEAAR